MAPHGNNCLFSLITLHGVVEQCIMITDCVAVLFSGIYLDILPLSLNSSVTKAFSSLVLSQVSENNQRLVCVM